MKDKTRPLQIVQKQVHLMQQVSLISEKFEHTKDTTICH